MKQIIFIVSIIIFFGCQNSQNEITTLPILKVGIQVSPAMALVMVADEKKFFEEYGVDVILEDFTAGKFALQAFLGGSLDVAISGEVPVTLASLQGNKLKVIAQVVSKTINECRIVAQRDGSLTNAKDYFEKRKRKISTSFGGGPEFFTHEFFNSINVSLSEVDLISQKPEDMPAALKSGSVDAISVFDPFAQIAENLLGEEAVVFSDSSIYSELYVVDVKSQTIDKKNKELIGFLKGLKKAETYIVTHPEDSKSIVRKYTKLNSEVIDQIWDNFSFQLRLNDLFVKYTTAQAKWLKAKGSIDKTVVIPNFKNIIDTSLLYQVDKTFIDLE